MTPFANGDFEEQLAPDQPAGWYYLRQAKIDEGRPRAGHVITFTNQVNGRGCGRLCKPLASTAARWRSCRCNCGSKPAMSGQAGSPKNSAKVLVSFFDEDRVPVGEQTVGPWSGSFSWSRRAARIKVPPQVRVAIVAMGLLGATGELSCDDVEIRPGASRLAKR